MTLLAKIKEDQLSARKGSKTVAAKLLTTLIGEAQAIGKNDGNRETTDNEVIAIIKKFINNINDCLTVYKTDSENYHVAIQEKAILTQYLPQQMNESELTTVVQDIIKETNATAKDMGKIMSALKAKYEGLYDGKAASGIVKSVLAG